MGAKACSIVIWSARFHLDFIFRARVISYDTGKERERPCTFTEAKASAEAPRSTRALGRLACL